MARLRISWSSLLAVVVAMFGMVQSAGATQTDQYDPFSSCPTSAAALNDPASEIALCGAGTAQDGKLKVGDVVIPISRLNVQFAAIGLGLGDPECPQQGLCFGRVPGTTTLTSAPTLIEVGQHADRRGRRLRRHGHRSNGKGLHLKVTLELAGDIGAVSPGFLFGLPVPLFKLPVKLHVEAPWLDRDCHVGSNDAPIFVTAFVAGLAGPPGLLDDPNGFQAEVVAFPGMRLVDDALTLPAAEGCRQGNAYGRGSLAGGGNRAVNDALGLPSPSGSNELILDSADVAFAATGFDGTPPDGGAELQAAFDAAK